MIMDTLGCQPSQPVNQCGKISHCQIARVLCPVSFRNAQGPRRPPIILCNCTGELGVHPVHPVHLFTKLGTCPLTKSGGFPTPCIDENLRVPGTLRNEHLKFAGGIDAYGVWGYVPLQMWCNSCNWCNDGW